MWSMVCAVLGLRSSTLWLDSWQTKDFKLIVVTLPCVMLFTICSLITLMTGFPISGIMIHDLVSYCTMCLLQAGTVLILPEMSLKK